MSRAPSMCVLIVQITPLCVSNVSIQQFFAQELRPNSFVVHNFTTETVGEPDELRHTIGYENQFGGRRMKASLSYSYIQNYTQIGSRTTLSKALHNATQDGYIHRVSAGCFHAKKSQRRAAAFAVRWRSAARLTNSSSENGPAQSEQFTK